MSLQEAVETTVSPENVVCVYCGQVMGQSFQRLFVDPKTNRQKAEIITSDNPNLSPTCSKSPDGDHANMTPEQAQALGFNV